MAERIVIALSGGMDSSTVLGYYVDKGFDVVCVHFQYGSKHNEFEKESIVKVADYYDVPISVVDMTTTFSNIQSNLLKTGGAIPEGHYSAENMSLTVIPGRNTIFAAVMCGIAESQDAEYIALGVHQGDHAIYPDCRKEYIESLNQTLSLASDGKVSVQAPFIDVDKIGICQVGLDLKVPYELTRTCYKNQPVSCGRCGSCGERLLAFHLNGVEDPIEYEDREYYKQFI